REQVEERLDGEAVPVDRGAQVQEDPAVGGVQVGIGVAPRGQRVQRRTPGIELARAFLDGCLALVGDVVRATCKGVDVAHRRAQPRGQQHRGDGEVLIMIDGHNHGSILSGGCHAAAAVLALGDSMPRPILATIHVPALSHNLEVVGGRLARDAGASRPSIWAVIKARAYGHGIDQAVEGFAAADGLAMLDLDEAVRCRERGWSGPLLLLEGFFEPADVPVLAHYRITTVIPCSEQFVILGAAPFTYGLGAFGWLEAGMRRLGCQAAEYPAAYQRALDLQSEGVLGTVGKMTLFARADDDPAVTAGQLQLFSRTTADFPGPAS